LSQAGSDWAETGPKLGRKGGPKEITEQEKIASVAIEIERKFLTDPQAWRSFIVKTQRRDVIEPDRSIWRRANGLRRLHQSH
jgi:hypothetical protein